MKENKIIAIKKLLNRIISDIDDSGTPEHTTIAFEKVAKLWEATPCYEYAGFDIQYVDKFEHSENEEEHILLGRGKDIDTALKDLENKCNKYIDHLKKESE